MERMFLRFLLCLILCIPLTARASKAWVVVDTASATVSVLQSGQTVLRLKGAAFGRGGVGALHVHGDGRTPLGSFRIVSINHQSRFHLFFGLNYPTLTQASVGFQKGIIDKTALNRIVQASADGRLPPQNTPLGGDIGIHGLGKGALWMHQHFNWTEGCVALTNEQIEKLAPWLEIGTRVVIQ
jgi:murein L,D-transpeptidase YafK